MGWCKHCAKTRDLERDPINGFLCCSSCGRVIDQDVFSTEVTFIKGAGGQSQMSGNFVRTVQGEHSESHERTLNKGKRRRQKDKFWKHADQLDNGCFKCKFCEKNVYGDISRLKYHLAGVNGYDVAPCKKVTNDIQAVAFADVNADSNNKKHKSTTAESGTGSTSNSSTQHGQRHATMEELVPKMDKPTWEKYLYEFFVKNNIPFNVVQSEAFINLIKGAALYGSSVPIPSYKTLCGRIILEAKKDVEKYIGEVKLSWMDTGCTILFDLWTDLKKQSFINVIAYSPGGALFLKSEEFSHARMTDQFIFDILDKTIQNIGPNNVVQIISDKTSNYGNAFDMLLGKYRWLFKIQCATHGINVMLKNIYEDVKWVQKIFDEAKQIVDFLYKSAIVLQLMRKFINKELKYSHRNRFASHFLMLQSVVEVEEKLRLLVASTEWSGMRNSRSVEAVMVVDIIQRESFWNNSKEILGFIEPIIRILHLVDDDGANSGYLYEAMERAREVLKKLEETDNRYGQILKIFDEGRDANILGVIHYAAAILNPAYFCSPRFKKIHQFKEAMDFVGDILVSSDERADYYRQLAAYQMKNSRIFSSSAMIMMQTSHPRRDEISDMVVSLGIGGGNSIIDPAFAFYKIAVERNFTRGRRTSQVAAACLYIACRYVLGAVFLQLCKLLRLEEHPIVQKPVDPSLFIHRFTERLLGGKNIEVSRAALRLIASMKRDWMQTGRKPSGLCGAALYISALSHGLRYSKSDVVSVVHICEATLTKRLIEFENTESGSLTIEEFNTKAEELENESRLKQLNVESKMSGMTELLCEHKGRGDAHFAHGLCKLCYKDFVELSGGLLGGSEPPAFQRAERERMEKASVDGVKESSPVSTPCHRDKKQKQSDKGEESVRENHPDVIENDGMDSGPAADHHFNYQDGSCQSQGNEDMDNVVGDESETLSDIDDVEVGGYLHTEEEKHYKKIIWEEMNREYLEEQAAKEATAAAAKEAQEADLQNCSEDLLNARELAAAAAAAVAKSRMERKQKRAANARNGTPAQTAAEATREMLNKKRLSSKINYEVLEKLFDDSTAPEKSKEKRVESDPNNDAYGQQISKESGEKELGSDVVDNNDDFMEDGYEEGDGGVTYGDGSYYGNEEDGYGYDDGYDYDPY